MFFLAILIFILKFENLIYHYNNILIHFLFNNICMYCFVIGQLDTISFLKLYHLFRFKKYIIYDGIESGIF